MACKFEGELKRVGQHDVLRFWSELAPSEKEELERYLEEVEGRVGLAKVGELLAETSFSLEKQDQKEIAPPSPECFGRTSDESDRLRWEAGGLQLVAGGKCAAVVMAGGQGSRLGSTFPKGMLGDGRVDGADIGLPSGKSLFRLQAERILKVQQLAAERFPGLGGQYGVVSFLVMTSHATHEATKEYFEAQGYFGLSSQQVMFFQQGRMPALDQEGKILLATKCSLQMSPDGNGGIYPALSASGALDWLQERGVQYVQVYSVDNILVRVADPVHYGFCSERGLDASAKAARKRDASEAVGVFAMRNGLYGVIEYSEIGEERAKHVDNAGELLYGAANIAIHCYSLDFLRGPAQAYCSKATIWHIANKTITTVDGPVPGIKLEAFIFDAFAVSQRFGLLQVSREEEFSAIKNSEDKPRDTPKTALQDLSRLHKSWFARHGVAMGDRVVEISPSYSYAGEGLESAALQWPQTSQNLKEAEPVYFS